MFLCRQGEYSPKLLEGKSQKNRRIQKEDNYKTGGGRSSDEKKEKDDPLQKELDRSSMHQRANYDAKFVSTFAINKICWKSYLYTGLPLLVTISLYLIVLGRTYC